MDEESVGKFGLLLIITALVMSQSLRHTHAMPALPDLKFPGVVAALSWPSDADANSAAALSQ